MKELAFLLPLQARANLYNLISFLFDLANVIWGDKDNSIPMDDLQIMQSKAKKIVLDLPCYASSIDALGWPILSQCRLVNRYITTFKYIDGLVDHDFNVLKNSDIHGYITRSNNDFRLPLVRTNYGEHRFIYKGIKE